MPRHGNRPGRVMRGAKAKAKLSGKHAPSALEQRHTMQPAEPGMLPTGEQRGDMSPVAHAARKMHSSQVGAQTQRPKSVGAALAGFKRR